VVIGTDCIGNQAIAIVKLKCFLSKTNLDTKETVGYKFAQGCHGRDHMVVGFTTTYAISAYHH
jgi:hypothetical protein